jgi:hypothetical protein
MITTLARPQNPYKETLLDLSAFGPGASIPPRRILKENIYFLLYLCFFAQEL